MFRKFTFSKILRTISQPCQAHLSFISRSIYRTSLNPFLPPSSNLINLPFSRSYSPNISIPIHTTQAVETAMKILADKKILRQRDVDDYFTKYAESMNMTQLINFLYFCTKKSLILDSDQLKKFSTELYSKRGTMDSAQLGKILYSMKLYSGKSAAERELIQVIHSKIDGSSTLITSQTIANMLYGLNKMNSHREEIQTLLTSLATLIARSQHNLNGQEIASALYGLQGMNSSHEAVKDIIRVLSRKIEFSSSQFTSQIVSNSLFGLQEMKADNKEVLFLLRVLKYKMDQCNEVLTPLAVSNSLYGLKSMTSDSPIVRKLLVSLARLIQPKDDNVNEKEETMKWNNEPLTCQGIACSLYGLQWMSSDHEEVRILLAALAQRMGRTVDLMSSQHIGMSLHGFKNMSSKEPEVRSLVKLVADIIGRSQKPIDTHGIALGLYGMGRLSSEHEETLSLLQALTPRIIASNEPFLAITVASTLVSFQSLNIYDSPIVLDYMRSVFTHIKRCNELFKPLTICKVLQTLKFCGVSPRYSGIDEGYRAECDQFLSMMLSDLTLKLQAAMKTSPPQIFPIEALGNAFTTLLILNSERMEGKFLKQLLFSNIKRCSERKEKFPLPTALTLLRGYHDMKIDTLETKQGLKIILQRIAWWAEHFEEENDVNSLSDPEGLEGSDNDDHDNDEIPIPIIPGKMKNQQQYEVITLSNQSQMTTSSLTMASSLEDAVELPSPLSQIQFPDLLKCFDLCDEVPKEFQSNLFEDLIVIVDALQRYHEEQAEAEAVAKRLEEEKKRKTQRPTRRRKNLQEEAEAISRPSEVSNLQKKLGVEKEDQVRMKEILTKARTRYEGKEFQSRVERVLERLGGSTD